MYELRKNLLRILLLTTLAGSTNALGQFLNPRVTVFGGASLLGGDRVFIVDDDPFQSEFENGGKFGFRLTVDLTDILGLEAAYGFAHNNLRIIVLEEFPPEERRFEVGVHQFIANALYYFATPDESLRPFVTAGIGWTRFRPTDEAQLFALADKFIDAPAEIKASNKFNFNFGGGVEVWANQWLGARIDVRDHITGIPRFGVPEESRGPDGAFFPVSGLVHNTELSVGAVFYLP